MESALSKFEELEDKHNDEKTTKIIDTTVIKLAKILRESARKTFKRKENNYSQTQH